SRRERRLPARVEPGRPPRRPPAGPWWVYPGETATSFTSAMWRPAATEASSGVTPLWRASMYAAYQSHQSCAGATASKEPWRSEVSCKRSVRVSTSPISVLPLSAAERRRDLLELPAVAYGVAARRLGVVGEPWR